MSFNPDELNTQHSSFKTSQAMAQANEPQNADNTQSDNTNEVPDRYRGKTFAMTMPEIGLNTLQIRAMLDAIIYNQALIMTKLEGKENDDQTLINFIDDTYDQIDGNMDELLKRYLEDRGNGGSAAGE
jgi:hypothetical protein